MLTYDFSDFEVRDDIRGIVINNTKTGTILILETGETAFAKFGGLEVGDEVICSIRKPAKDNLYMFVNIDGRLRAA